MSFFEKIGEDNKYLRIYLEYMSVIMFVFATGAICYCGILSASISGVVYLLFSICLLLSHKRIKFPPILMWTLLVYMYADVYVLHMGGHKEHTVITYTIFFVATSIVLGTFDFYRFRYIFTRVVAWITGIGLIVWLLSILHILPMIVVYIKGWPYSLFGCYVLGWGSIFGRYAGIWHEPGACMITLNVILLLHYKEISTWTWENNKQLRRIVVIALGVICTKSTGGYLVFAMIMGMCAWNFKLRDKRKSMYVKFGVILLGIVSLGLLLTSDVVQKKLIESDSSDYSTSKGMRFVENLSLIELFVESPIVGVGLGSEYQWDYLEKNRAMGCSNGLLYYLSGLGLLWFLPFVFLLVKTIKKLNGHIPWWLALATFLVVESNEQYIMYPITFLFIIPFLSYNKPEYLSAVK